MKKLNKLGVLLIVLHTFSASLAQTGSVRYDFNDAYELNQWKRFYQEENWPDMMKSIRIAGGKLVMEPTTCGWYADYHAPFIYLEVEGDFRATTSVEIKGVKNARPQSTWSLSGLMVRKPLDHTSENWRPNRENWLFLTTGVANNINQPVFETKTTVNSKSVLKLHPNRMEQVELRIERQGALFTLSYKYEGEDWVEIETFERNDLPGKLQVGLNGYTDFYGADRELRSDYMKYNTTVLDVNPDLSAEYDYFIVEKL